MTLSHNTGALTVTLGQATGTKWGNAIIIYAAQGSAVLKGLPVVPSAAVNIINGNFVSGGTVTVYVQALPPNSAVGTSASGSIWACYTLSPDYMTYNTNTGTCFSGTNSIRYIQISTLSTRAV